MRRCLCVEQLGKQEKGLMPPWTNIIWVQYKLSSMMSITIENTFVLSFSFIVVVVVVVVFKSRNHFWKNVKLECECETFFGWKHLLNFISIKECIIWALKLSLASQGWTDDEPRCPNKVMRFILYGMLTLASSRPRDLTVYAISVEQRFAYYRRNLFVLDIHFYIWFFKM